VQTDTKINKRGNLERKKINFNFSLRIACNEELCQNIFDMGHSELGTKHTVHGTTVIVTKLGCPK
jgi:hypothetical protein